MRSRRCCNCVDALSDAFIEMKTGAARSDIEAMFYAHYARIARVIASILRDPARAEELAVEVFLKWSRAPKAQQEGAAAWLYRTAVRTGLNELRQQTRRRRRETLFSFGRNNNPTPEELFSAEEEQGRLDLILSSLEPRQAELLILRSQGLSYEELAGALDLNSASIGTLLRRAQEAFRKEYTKRYERQ